LAGRREPCIWAYKSAHVKGQFWGGS